MSKTAIVTVALAFIGAMLFNRFLDGPLYVGVVLFTLYLVANSLLVKGEFPDSELGFLLSGFLVLCIVLISESLVLILKLFYTQIVVLPLLAIPLILGLTCARDLPKQSGLRFNLSKFGNVLKNSENRVILLYALLLVVALFFALSFRTARLVFSVFDIVPWMYWPAMFAVIVLFAFMYIVLASRSQSSLLWLPVFLLCFLFFGVYLVTTRHGFDADPYAWLGYVKVLLVQNSREQPWVYIVTERGFESVWATITKVSISSTAFNPLSEILLINSTGPILSAIYLPAFTYLITNRLVGEHSKSLSLLASTASLFFFPTFFHFAVTMTMYLGAIFLLGTLCFGVLYVSQQPSRRGGARYLWAMALTVLAASLVHEIPGVFSLCIFLIALVGKKLALRHDNPASSSQVENSSTSIREARLSRLPERYVSVIFAAMALSVVPTLALLEGQAILSVLNPFQQTGGYFAPSINRALAFFSLPVISMPSNLNAFVVLGPYFNWVRVPLLAVGVTFVVMRERSIASRIVVGSAVFSFLSWFLSYSVTSFPYGYYRLALMADVLLLPLVSYLVYRLVEKLSCIRFSTRKTAAVAISLTIVMSLGAGITLAIPTMTWNGYSATPGRPTLRAVTSYEIEACTSMGVTGGNYTVITSDIFLQKVCSGFVTVRSIHYEYYSLVSSPTLIQDFVRTGNATIFQSILMNTESSTLFLFFGQWFLTQSGLSSTLLANLSTIPGLQIHTYGTGYVEYVIELT